MWDFVLDDSIFWEKKSVIVILKNSGCNNDVPKTDPSQLRVGICL